MGARLLPTGDEREVRLPSGAVGLRDEARFTGPFSFIVAADTQLGFSDDASWGGAGVGDWETDIANCRKLVQTVNRMCRRGCDADAEANVDADGELDSRSGVTVDGGMGKAVEPPRFLIVCGDLVHAMPPGLRGARDGGRASHERYANAEAWKSQNAAFRDVFAELNSSVPLVCVCGNHDVGDRPSPESIANYEQISGSKSYFGFWCGGMRALVLNSQLLNDPLNAEQESKAQEVWLERELQLFRMGRGRRRNADETDEACTAGDDHRGNGDCDGGVQVGGAAGTAVGTHIHAGSDAGVGASETTHLVVFQHIPWLLESEAEQVQAYYCMNASARERWLPKLAQAGCTKVFCGHFHRNNVSVVKNVGLGPGVNDLEIVTTSAVGKQLAAEEVLLNRHIENAASDTKAGFRLVHVGADEVTHEYVEFS